MKCGFVHGVAGIEEMNNAWLVDRLGTPRSFHSHGRSVSSHFCDKAHLAGALFRSTT